MMHDVRSIPPAPRRVRWRALLAHRWPLLAAGGGMVVLGALIAWGMLLQSGGKLANGPALDAGPVTRVPGVVRVASEPRAFAGKHWQEVRYDYPWLSVQLRGTCFVPAEVERRIGDEVQVEVLASNPNVSRIVGGVLHVDREWLRARFWIAAMVVPGSLILLGWLASMFQLRQVIVHGDVSVGHITRVTRVPFVLPEMLLVRYEFRDHRAIARRNRHWVRAHGPLGARLVAQLDDCRFEAMPVLHDRRMPQWNRLLLPPDFLPTPAGANEGGFA